MTSSKIDSNQDLQIIDIFIVFSYTVDSQKENKLNFTNLKELIQKPKLLLSQETEVDNGKKKLYSCVYTIKAKFKKSSKSKTLPLSCEFEVGNDYYDMSFNGLQTDENKNIKDVSFIYDVSLNKKSGYFSSKIKVPQMISNSSKFNLFLSALQNEKCEEKFLNTFYLNSIELYSKMKEYSLLIYIFEKVFNIKELCEKLMEKFKAKIDDDKNLFRDPILENHKEQIKNIVLNSNKILSEKLYDKIMFYGILLSYLNFYDNEEFVKLSDILYEKEKEVLFKIMLLFQKHFKTFIKINNNMIKDFIEYSLDKNLIDALQYIPNLVIFLKLINEHKENIKNIISFKSINLKEFNHLKILEERNNNIPLLCDLIDEITSYSSDNKIAILILNSAFWHKFYNYLNKVSDKNINDLSRLRKSFIKYYKSVVKPIIKSSTLLTELNEYYIKDELGQLIHKIVNEYIKIKSAERDKINTNNENKITDLEIINLIKDFDIYYDDSDEDNNKKYINKREVNFLDYIKYEEINEDFIEQFKNSFFEKKLINKIIEYEKKLIAKIKDIEQFDIVIKLINVDKIKMDFFINQLILKYDELIQTSLAKKEQKDLIRIISNLAEFIYTYDKNNTFYKKIKKLNESYSYEIYCELMKSNNNIICANKELKHFIITEFTSKLSDNNINKIVMLLEFVKDINDINFIYEEIEKYIITENDFYSKAPNLKIKLLYELYKNNLLKKNEEEINRNKYNKITLKILKDIYKEFEEKEITITNLGKLLENKDNIIINRLDILNILGGTMFNTLYNEYKNEYKKIIDTINTLESIKNSLEKYHLKVNDKQIKQINFIVNNTKNGQLKIYYTKDDEIQELLTYKVKAEKINKVKDLNIFNYYYNKSDEKDQNKNFDDCFNKLLEYKSSFEVKNLSNELIPQINKLFGKDKTMISEEINKLYNFYEIKGAKTFEEMVDHIDIMGNIKKYFEIIDSIIQFLEQFNKQKDKFYENLLNNKNAFKNGNNYEIIKKELENLKNNKIYDYKNEEKYIEIFKCLYNKNEAMDFLMNQKTDDVLLLHEKIEPIDNTLDNDDINDAAECTTFINKLKDFDTYSEIFEYIRTNINDNNINKFLNYSKIYPSILELHKNFSGSSVSIYKEVNNILNNSNFNFTREKDEFYYIDDEHNKKSIEGIKKLKNIKNEIQLPVNIEDDNKTKEKNMPLKIFKKLTDNLEFIYEYMTILRKKGSTLPIYILVKVYIKEKNIDNNEIKKSYHIEYYLKNEIITFDKLKKYLFEFKEDIINQINEAYKKVPYLRFVYGNQFNILLEHIRGFIELLPYFKYLFNNNTQNKYGKKGEARNTEDYVKSYKLYTKDSLQIISNYIKSLLQNNGIDLKDIYKSMIIQKKYNYKGIYTLNSKESISQDILKIFLYLTNNLPVYQNILICNKNKSYEEMNAFFHRALLCEYNALFIIEINKTFTKNQQSNMMGIINSIINCMKEEQNKNNIDKNIKVEIKPCILFIYKEKEIDPRFLNNIRHFKEYEGEFQGNFENNISSDISNYYSNSSTMNLDNSGNDSGEEKLNEIYRKTHIIKSDICGLGKSKYIDNQIKENNKIKYYFPLGGSINKNIIFNKLDNLLKKIDDASDYNNIAIHLDLYETEDIDILNEFLFNFLITKIYSNGENYLYINKKIEIYVEIPNCFNDFLKNYTILSSFDIKNIEINSLEDLKLDDSTLGYFKKIYNFSTNKEVFNFIKDKIGLKNYSYHQIQIFIKLFISQYSKYNSKLTFFKGKKVVTEDILEHFYKCAKYFTSGAYSEFLNNSLDKNKKRNLIDELSKCEKKDLKEEYENPLVFINQKKDIYYTLNISNKKLDEELQKSEYINDPSLFYLDKFITTTGIKNTAKKLKEIIDKDKYVITSDNFRKMMLIYYRLEARLPLIIVGETGCGKTTLIKKLNQLLNNGNLNLEIIHLDAGKTDEFIINKLKK